MVVVTQAIQSRENKYIIENILGEGTYATVYKGFTNDIFKLPRAFKIINITNISPQQQKSIRNEIRILRKLTSKFPDPQKSPFLHLYDAFNDGKFITIVTEIVDGQELDVFCSKKKRGVPEQISKKIIYNILTAVQLLHKEEICHLDLKLENIMIDKQTFDVKILDFGFSRRTRSKMNLPILQKTYCGSLHYVPNEIIDNIPFDGIKADIWSLGVTFFTLLSGFFPFDSNTGNSIDIFDKIHKNRPKIPDFISEEASSLISSMLNSNPKIDLKYQSF